MSEKLIISAGNKEEKYELLYSQIKGLIGSETNLIANLSNSIAAINMTFHFLWVGVYFVDLKSSCNKVSVSNELDSLQLVLGPFQGPVACTRINYNKGVCGVAWAKEKSIVVGDVHNFHGHIACSSDSRSEIVIPIFDENNRVYAVLDIDSECINTFDEIDRIWLEQIVTLFDVAF